MIKKITKLGNSQGVIFDTAIMELARLKVGDEVDVVVHDGGAITLTPVRPLIELEDARASARSIIRSNDKLFRRLA